MAFIVKNENETYNIIDSKGISNSLSKQEVIIFYKVNYGERTSVYEELNKLEKKDYAEKQRKRREG